MYLVLTSIFYNEGKEILNSNDFVEFVFTFPFFHCGNVISRYSK